MEPTAIVTIEFSHNLKMTYQLGEESDKDVISLIQRLGVLLKTEDIKVEPEV
jgi:hypothetical protein